MINVNNKNYQKIEVYLGNILRRIREYDKKGIYSTFLNEGIFNQRFESLICKLEKNNIKNFKNIFSSKDKLFNERTFNDFENILHDLISELRGTAFLIESKFDNITFNKKSVDFIATKENKKYAIEIKFIRGPSFKKSKKVFNLAYNLESEPLIKKIKDKIEEGYRQVKKFSRFSKILILISNNDEYIFLKSKFIQEICDFIKKEEELKGLEIFFINNWGKEICGKKL